MVAGSLLCKYYAECVQSEFDVALSKNRIFFSFVPKLHSVRRSFLLPSNPRRLQVKANRVKYPLFGYCSRASGPAQASDVQNFR